MCILFSGNTKFKNHRDGGALLKDAHNVLDNSADFCKTRPDGLYADPEDCHSFYSCWGDGQHSSKNSCGPDFIFNPYLKFCDWPSYYKCPKPESRLANPYPSPNIEGIPKQKRFTCKNLPDGRHADPNDCSVYYTCRGNGELLVKHMCGYDLVYNPNIQTCDWPVMYDCPYKGNSERYDAGDLQKSKMSKKSDSELYFKGRKKNLDSPVKDPTTASFPTTSTLQTTTTSNPILAYGENNRQQGDKEGGIGDGEDTATGPVEFTCEGLPDGVHADPLHASNYYTCYNVNGRFMSKHTCGRDLVFDPIALICDMPEHNQMSSSSSASLSYSWSVELY